MIYFITDGAYTKVGVALEPEKRLRELQTGNPFDLRIAKTIEGSYEEESKLHSVLQLYRMRGEWFEWNNFDDELIDLLLTEEPSGVFIDGERVSRSEIILRIESAIEAIKSVPHDTMITRGKISSVSGLSYKTVCKYLDAIPQLKDCEVVDGRTEAAIRVNELLERGLLRYK